MKFKEFKDTISALSIPDNADVTVWFNAIKVNEATRYSSKAHHSLEIFNIIYDKDHNILIDCTGDAIKRNTNHE